MLNRKIGRNDPCPCGSGKKYKQCCQLQVHASTPPAGGYSAATGVDAIQAALGYYQAGQLVEAETICRRLLEASPNHPDGLHLAGMIAAHLGKKATAVELIDRAIGIRPAPAMYYNLASVFHDFGQLEAAVENYRKALRLKPDFVEAYCNLGLALTEQGKLDAAIESCRKALALRPDFAEAYNNLGNALKDQGRLDAASACYREAIKLKPTLVEVYSNLGNTFQEQGEIKEATENFRRALKLNPDDAEAHIGLGRVYQDTGQFGAAREQFDRALALKPDHPEAWAALSVSRKMTADDLPWAEKARRLLKGTLKLQEEMRLWYALGKYDDDIGQYGDAFTCYERANELKRRLVGPFDRNGFRRLVDMIIPAHTTETMQQQAKGSASRRPLFIVGMPRSGTSLTEQILASHPDVFGAGELRFWTQHAQKHLSTMSSWHCNTPLLQDLANQYEAELQRHSVTALRVVDKMPDNFLHLGLIHAVFPDARILHTRRNPVDTCLSIYFQNFSNGHAYANDLDDLAFYYREYHRLMAHWRAVLPPEVFLEVPYEALVEDQERWSRKIIDFIGLDWNERCLNFHETERKVGTASNWQVRQKIYKTSKERWRNYEKFVGPLLPLLELAE